MSDLALSVRGLSKSYTIAHQATQKESTLAETVLQRLKRPFARSTKETFWALKDVSFDVKKGEVVGIIGRNGAGKSTLLKVLSRISEPTEGQIDLYGRVGSLLEVGTGFHPELTGRENVFLNGAILGMSRAEIKRQFDAIVDFAGVEKFLDTPVKRYSSGMYVRLAFAVAAHLRSEILIVDEVLAVGDAEFQKKCLGKMQDVAHDGRTVLFVSHNMSAVYTLCNVGVLLRGGRMIRHGDVSSAIAAYSAAKSAGRQDLALAPRSGSGEIRYVSASTTKSVFVPSEHVDILFEIKRLFAFEAPFYLSALIVDQNGNRVTQLDSRFVRDLIRCDTILEGSLKMKTPWLKPGRYSVDLYICGGGVIDAVEGAVSFDVEGRLPYCGTAGPDAIMYAAVLGDFEWSVGPAGCGNS